MRQTRDIKKQLFNKKVLVTLALIIFVLIAFLKFREKSQAKKNNNLSPVLVETLSEDTLEGSNFLLSGIVKPKSRQTIHLDTKKGKVLETNIKEGDEVKKGQILFQYTSEEMAFELKKTELEFDNQQKVVNQKQEESGFKWSRYNERYQELETAKANLNAGAEEDLSVLEEEKKQKEDLLNQSLEEARLADTEVSNAQLELEQKKLALDTLRKQNEGNSVAADIDGRVVKIAENQLNSEVFDSKEAFIEIVDTSEYYIEGVVDEFRKDQLSLEQKTEVIDRTNEKNKWTGKICKIDELSSTDDKSQNETEENPNLSKYPYKVIMEKKDPLPELDKNVYVLVKPLAEVKEIYLPLEYVKEKNGKYSVWVVRNGKLTENEVSAEKIADLDALKILKGLSKKDKIVINSKENKEGMEVR